MGWFFFFSFQFYTSRRTEIFTQPRPRSDHKTPGAKNLPISALIPCKTLIPVMHSNLISKRFQCNSQLCNNSHTLSLLVQLGSLCAGAENTGFVTQVPHTCTSMLQTSVTVNTQQTNWLYF